jgi:hypothetical protein
MAAGVARPVRITRRTTAPGPRPTVVAISKVVTPSPTPAEAPWLERRPNRAATRRAIRLSALYAAGVGAVYAGLVALAETGPASGSTGLDGALALAGGLAAAIVVVGTLVALGAAPRAVELHADATVVLGRFGRRYSFPPPAELRTTVLQRIPSGLLASVALETVEIAGGSTRRSFLLEEHLLDPPGAPADLGAGSLV